MIQVFDNSDKSGLSYGYPRVHFSREERHGPVRTGTVFLKDGKPTPLDEHDASMNLIVNRPVRSIDGAVHQPDSGLAWLGALHQHYNGSYYHASPVIHSPDDEGTDFDKGNAIGKDTDNGYPEWPIPGVPIGIEDNDDTGREPLEQSEYAITPQPLSENSGIEEAHNLVSAEEEPAQTSKEASSGTVHALGSEGVSPEATPDEDTETLTLKKDEGLKIQKATTKTIFKSMPVRARKNLGETVENVVYLHTPEELMEALAESDPEGAREAQEKGIKLHGAYDQANKSILVAHSGDAQTDKEVQAATFARASANGADESPEWEQAWNKDIKGKLSLQADKDPKAGWAEFTGRLITSAGVNAEELAAKYPSATAYAQGLGMVPESNKKPMTQLVEALHSPSTLNSAEGDSAYSPQKAGLMTYARIGMRSAGEVIEGLQDKLQRVKDTLPKPLVSAVQGAMKYAFFSTMLAKKAVDAFEKQRGTNEKTRATLAKALVGADLVLGGQVFPAAVQMATSDWRLALASSFVPVGSLAYLAVAGGKDLLGWKKTAKAAHAAASKKDADFAGQISVEEIMDAISFHLERLPQDQATLDKWLVAFYAGLDATHGDIEAACDIADEVYRQAPAEGSNEEITDSQIDEAPELAPGEEANEYDSLPTLSPD